MVNIQKILESCGNEIPALLATSIVNIESGLGIAHYSINANFDPAVSSAAFAEVIKQNQMALDFLGGYETVGETEDILITTDKVYILLRQLGDKHYHGVAVSKKSNLGLARIIMKKYEIDFLETLKELGEL